MNLGEPIFLFILAFILLGPKRTSELARQVGKLMSEFRKASNDFKYQFNEEMRVSEQQEQQKKQEAERAALGAGERGDEQAALPAPGTVTEPENRILPPEQEPAGVSEVVPYAVSAVSATTGEEQPVEDHPLLRVDVIPPMNGAPADQTSTGSVTPTESPASEEPTAAREEDGATIHHG